MSYHDQRAAIERRNYYNDWRVQASMRSSYPSWCRFNANRNAFYVDVCAAQESGYFEEYPDASDWDEPFIILPARFEPCHTCHGKGSYVNPSIDSGGISGDEFAEDPEFFRSYMRGDYDQTCATCEGLRVVPVPTISDISIEDLAKRRDLPGAAWRAVLDWQHDEDDWVAMQAAELAMGA